MAILKTPLNDDSLMPFGKYKGKVMSDVPASYLHWYWTHDPANRFTPVGLYIKDNLDALKMEHPDAIWS